MSTQPCGCDEEAGWTCERHKEAARVMPFAEAAAAEVDAAIKAAHAAEQRELNAMLIADGRGVVRHFETGATRDSDIAKYDYEGFISPLVVKRFGEYMHKHRLQSDGKLRDSDNWQRGIPKDAYMKSAWRHFLDWWLHHRSCSQAANECLEDALCALLFNGMGYLHEVLSHRMAMKPLSVDAPRAAGVQPSQSALPART